MTTAVIYPGTFDPITFGHIDLIHRSLTMFDRVRVAVALNEGKNPLFNVEERIELIHQSMGQDDARLEVDYFGGLLVDYACEQKIPLILRGIRAFSDFEYEFQMALTNRKLKKDVDTVFMMPDEQYSYMSSRTIKEICQLGGDVSAFVPDVVAQAMKRKLGV